MKKRHIAYAYSCGLAVGLSRIKHSDAGLGVSAARVFNSANANSPYHRTIVHHDLSSRHSTRKKHGNVVLNVNGAHFPKYLLHSRVQCRRFYRKYRAAWKQ